MSAGRRSSTARGCLFTILLCLNATVWCGVITGVALLILPETPPSEEEHLARGIRVGEHAPDFTLPTLDGQEVRLSDFRGRAVLLNFWATWCPPCQEEIPLLETYHQRYPPSLAILAVNAGEKPSEVQAFARRQQLTFPVLLDTKAKISRIYQITSLPTSFFVDEEGVIRAMQIGMLKQEDMDANLLLVGVK